MIKTHDRVCSLFLPAQRQGYNDDYYSSVLPRGGHGRSETRWDKGDFYIHHVVQVVFDPCLHDMLTTPSWSWGGWGVVAAQWSRQCWWWTSREATSSVARLLARFVCASRHRCYVGGWDGGGGDGRGGNSRRRGRKKAHNIFGTWNDYVVKLQLGALEYRNGDWATLFLIVLRFVNTKKIRVHVESVAWPNRCQNDLCFMRIFAIAL